MRIAVPYENGSIFQHFGRTAAFKLYDAEDGEVRASAVQSTDGSGHGALVGFLRDKGVDALICGGIGGGAQTALAQAGIRLYGGVSGGADEAVRALLKLSQSNDIAIWEPADAALSRLENPLAVPALLHALPYMGFPLGVNAIRAARSVISPDG